MIDRSRIDYFTEDGSVEAVNARNAESMDPRLKEVMTSLVKHLHAFTKEVEISQDEWNLAIDFFTRTGHMCDEYRQEFILLSDIVGLSMLVDAINSRRPKGATENTVMGPFHIEGAPEYEMGANITLQGKGATCQFVGRVLDIEGNPIEGAKIDVWSDNEEGYYDVQQPDIQPLHNNRGVFRTGADGAYHFCGQKPVSYPIPDDGPVGQLLGHLGRHPNRPAHMHFIVSADGFDRVVTHTFVDDDPYLTSDAVFGVKESLIAQFEPVENGETEFRSRFDFVLNPA
ncbi:MAG: 6-chlorohydroxyquinol-1,2-dioxygenase [Alphaproteobacteria bacterium]|nr:6-chlorohydroxyquinol-1,2-dioxygenase [Alphaproteobacteria bacterium]